MQPVLIDCARGEDQVEVDESVDVRRLDDLADEIHQLLELSEDRPLLVRITGVPHKRLNLLLEHTDQYFAFSQVTGGEFAESSFYSIFRQRLGHPNGLVLAGHSPKRAVDRFIHILEFTFFKFTDTFAKKPKPPVPTEGAATCSMKLRLLASCLSAFYP